MATTDSMKLKELISISQIPMRLTIPSILNLNNPGTTKTKTKDGTTKTKTKDGTTKTKTKDGTTKTKTKDGTTKTKDKVRTKVGTTRIKCQSIKCQSIKCQSIKCQSIKCQSIKCQSIKFLQMKFHTACQLSQLSFLFSPPSIPTKSTSQATGHENEPKPVWSSLQFI